MKRLGWALICLLGLPTFAAAQAAPSPAAPSSTSTSQQSSAQPTATSAKSAPADYSQEAFVVELFWTAARYENDGTGERTTTARIRVQSDAGVQQFGELVFGYNSANEQLDIHYVRVRKPDGTLVTAAADAVKEMTAQVARDAPIYTDYKEKHITVPGLAAGAILEYEMTTRIITPFAPGEFWLTGNFLQGAIVLDERVEVNVPRDRKLNLISSPATPYETDHAEGRTIYRWKHSNLTRPSDDDVSKKDVPPQSADKKPDYQLSTFQSWADVGRWYANLAQGRTDPSPEIRAKTQELIRGRTSDIEKMQALYDYVSKSIRYVSLSFGLSRYQPHAASEIFANQYGDCKDKHTLLASMLQAAGIQAEAVLIPATSKLDVSIPSPSQFDHVITAVPQGGDLIWMDSTAEVAPFRLLTSPLRDKSALVVSADGSGKIVETPADPPFLSRQDVEITAQVSGLGKLTAHAHYSLRGDTEYVLRMAFRRTPQTRWKELGQTVFNLDGLRGEVTSVKPSDPSDTEKPFELDMDFTQANFLDWSSKSAKASLPILVLGLPSAPGGNILPIKLGSPLSIDVRLKLDLPPAFTAQPPIAVSISRDYAEFKSSYRFADHTISAERSLNFKMRELPSSRSSDYLAFARAIVADENQVLSVANATPGAPAALTTAKTDELVDAGLAALNSANPRSAIPLFQRVVELEPEHKQAWNDLGLAYMRIGSYDDAASAFQKQLGVNAYDEHANDYLGLVFVQQQKYSEAIAAFHKQVELNPLDLTAHAALGETFLSQHDYSQAVPELEKATILAPDNAQLQVALGRAYLNSNDKEKGLAAFEKGAEISQNPIVWNDIAYNLADNKIELDKAQQYAESAVSATAADLRNIDLAHLTLEQMGEVSRMGGVWDTLGWVYYQKGDLATAERYLRVAWMMNQHGEVGDHLAQLDDKVGRKDQAIHTYALALGAQHAVPETRARLTLLLGGNAQIDGLVSKARPELQSMRSFTLKGLSKQDASADFLLLLSPDGADGSGTRVDSVKFVSGSESLRPFGDQLRLVHYGAMFPDASPVKLVRRGTLACLAATGDCIFTVARPEDIHTIN